MAKTYKNLIGFYIEPEERPTWSGEILDLRTGELVKEPSMTKQSFKEECDINNIVRKFEATGQIDHINAAHAQGLFTDLPSGLDLQTSLDLIKQSEAAFMALPANVRAQFDNDPVQFVDYVDQAQAGNEDFQTQLVTWGVAKDNRPPPPPAPPPETPPVPPPAPSK